MTTYRRPDVHAGITAARKAKGWTLNQLADAMGMSVLTVARIEHPLLNRRVPLATVVRACDCLGVHPADVLGWRPARSLASIPGSP